MLGMCPKQDIFRDKFHLISKALNMQEYTFWCWYYFMNILRDIFLLCFIIKH